MTTGTQKATMSKLLKSYFQRYGICRHQIEGFDSFITSILPFILRESCKIQVSAEHEGTLYDHTISLDALQIVPPSHCESDGSRYSTMPMEAKARKLTYCLTVKARFRHVEKWDGKAVASNCHETQFNVPCMVGSKFCNLRAAGWSRFEDASDGGGYFIVNGHCKTLVAQQKLCINRIFVFPNQRWGRAAEVRSSNVHRWRSTSTLQMVLKNGRAHTFVPFVMKGTQLLPIPLETCIAALEGEEEAEAWIAEHSGFKGRWANSTEILPHLGLDASPATIAKKTLFLRRMEARLRSGAIDDRDSQVNRRVDGAGPSIGILFRQVFAFVGLLTRCLLFVNWGGGACLNI